MKQIVLVVLQIICLILHVDAKLTDSTNFSDYVVFLAGMIFYTHPLHSLRGIKDRMVSQNFPHPLQSLDGIKPRMVSQIFPHPLH